MDLKKKNEGGTTELDAAQLSKFDYVLMIDKSGSMGTQDCPGGVSRWKYAQEQTEAIARACEKFDSDGIDVVVFANNAKEYKGVTSDKVTQVFAENSPSMSTDTAGALKLVFDGYNARKKAGNAKPMIVVCITDGQPDSTDAVDKVIINHANSLQEDIETGVTFIQIGKDEAARRFLKHLDDDLKGMGAKFDIVDTKNYTEMENMSIEQIFIEAITD